MPIELVCDNCDDSYTVIPSRADSSSFCSMDCKSEYQSKSMTGQNNPSWSGGHLTKSECELCGELHEHRKDRPGKFCSRECKDENRKNLTGEDAMNWRGGRQRYYGENWKQRRREVRERDGACVECGINIEEHIEKFGRRPDVHHITPIKDFDCLEKANELNNLVLLCKECHPVVESGL
jgi:5-methylcytosine-specific restriction endonuclease McrA